MSDPAVQYGATGRNRAVRPFGVRFENVIKDIECEIVARRVVKQITVITPDNAKYRIAQTHSTFDDCIENWLSICRRSADKVEHFVRCGLPLQRLAQLPAKARDFRLLPGSRGTAPTPAWRLAPLRHRPLATSRFGVCAAYSGTPFHALPEGFGRAITSINLHPNVAGCELYEDAPSTP
jgi:hypothetical protein